jgi:hypothetical protein
MVNAAAETNLWPLAAVLPRVAGAAEGGKEDGDDRAAEAEALGALWQETLDDAVIEWGRRVSHEQYAAAVEQIEAAARAADVEALAALAVPVLGDDLLLDSMTIMFDAGADFVVQEAADAGVKIKPAKPAAELHPWMTVHAAATGAAAGQTIGAWARSLVARIAARVSAGLAGEALRLWRPGVTVQQMTDGVQDYWDGLTDAVPREHIGAGLSRATNLGKLETYAAAKPRGWRLELRADERLDRNTCKPCRDIDGTVLPDADAAGLAYGGAGYLFCKGRERCRGTVRGVWTNTAPKNDLDSAGLRAMLNGMRGLR